MKDVTLLFLAKKENGKITELCLAMKKRGFGIGRWNGAGGKLEAGETFEEAAKRETFEEIGVMPDRLEKIAHLTFIFPNKPEWDNNCSAYISESWQGELVESEEMRPEWFKVENLPFEKMWPDDSIWLPEVIEGKRVKASFIFGENDVILDKKVEIVTDITG
jgi:8-oxo-dGTP diphosphatase/2-hydroxy-dATP diphosphatase